MKMMIGFTTGFVAGAFVFAKLSEQQRSELEAKIDDLWRRGRSGDIRRSVSGGVGDVADAVTDKVTEATDKATSTVADKINDGNVAAAS